MTIRVIVRDGRMGADPALADAEGGEVLMEFEVDRPLEWDEQVGRMLPLPDGSEWPIIGMRDHLGESGWQQLLFIGDA